MAANIPARPAKTAPPALRAEAALVLVGEPAEKPPSELVGVPVDWPLRLAVVVGAPLATARVVESEPGVAVLEA